MRQKDRDRHRRQRRQRKLKKLKQHLRQTKDLDERKQLLGKISRIMVSPKAEDIEELDKELRPN